MAKFLQTERGGRKLIYGGFAYVKKKDVKKEIFWKCEKKDSAK